MRQGVTYNSLEIIIVCVWGTNYIVCAIIVCALGADYTTRSGEILDAHKNVDGSGKDVEKPILNAERNVGKTVGRNASEDEFPTHDQHGIRNASLYVVFIDKNYGVGNTSLDVIFVDSYRSVENDFFRRFCASYTDVSLRQEFLFICNF